MKPGDRFVHASSGNMFTGKALLYTGISFTAHDLNGPVKMYSFHYEDREMWGGVVSFRRCDIATPEEWELIQATRGLS